ncbi:MAG: DUF4249 domain-containing protein [Reichenbachiella sp.]|uniref:DUF4249 domain-containing protein n=1 Tax=Reichenbachiella sp. TaxID=2184521 RepID=UPI003267849C
MQVLKYINILTAIILVSSCDDQIYPELNDAPEILVVDAWVNDKPEDQVIRLTRTQPYFDNSESNGVSGAEVYLTDNEGTRFDFVDSGSGDYVWSYTTEVFGTTGNSYRLTVNTGGETFTATSVKNRVPTVDSVTFKFENKIDFGQEDEYYLGEFWSRDLEGFGDTYWIKSFKNEEYLGKPSEINIAWDAGFSEGGAIDGLIFIPPIRDAVNPFDEKEDTEGEFYSPFADGDSLYVEVHSITPAAHSFLSELRIQTDRPGGFAALFDTPLSNIPTNIENTTSDELVVGFFCMSSVEGNGNRLDISQVPKEE